MSMATLPDDALVVRGGMNEPENFENGSGVRVGGGGKLDGVSVNSSPGASVIDLTKASTATGYPGILNNRIGVTTVGKIRAAGGDVVASPTKKNPNHATLKGLTAEEPSRMFQPTLKHPGRGRK